MIAATPVICGLIMAIAFVAKGCEVKNGGSDMVVKSRPKAIALMDPSNSICAKADNSWRFPMAFTTSVEITGNHVSLFMGG